MAVIEVHNQPEQGRYAVTVDGVDAGGAYYEISGDSVVFTHTEVGSEWAGQGVGSALARAALDDVRSTGRLAVPRCPFIAAYIRRHPEYLDIVDPKYRARVSE